MTDREIREFTKETLRKQMVLLAERSTVAANSVEELCALTNCMTHLVNPLSWYFPETVEKEPDYKETAETVASEFLEALDRYDARKE